MIYQTHQSLTYFNLHSSPQLAVCCCYTTINIQNRNQGSDKSKKLQLIIAYMFALKGNIYVWYFTY